MIFMRTEADWNTGPKITIAALLKKNIPTWKKNIPFSVVLGHDVVNSRELFLSTRGMNSHYPGSTERRVRTRFGSESGER